MRARLAGWRERLDRLRLEVEALALAARDPRTPWYAKAIVAGVVAYALSPIDLIPDPIPVLGYLDDLLLVPLGIALAVRLIPPDVLADCRARAGRRPAGRARWVVAGLIVALWIGTAVGIGYLVIQAIR